MNIQSKSPEFGDVETKYFLCLVEAGEVVLQKNRSLLIEGNVVIKASRYGGRIGRRDYESPWSKYLSPEGEALEAIYVVASWAKVRSGKLRVCQIEKIFPVSEGFRSFESRVWAQGTAFERAMCYKGIGEPQWLAVYPPRMGEVLIPSSQSGKFGWVLSGWREYRQLRKTLLSQKRESKGRTGVFYTWYAGSPWDGNTAGFGNEVPEKLNIYCRARGHDFSHTPIVGDEITYDLDTFKVLRVVSGGKEQEEGAFVALLPPAPFKEWAFVKVGRTMNNIVRNSLKKEMSAE